MLLLLNKKCVRLLFTCISTFSSCKSFVTLKKLHNSLDCVQRTWFQSLQPPETKQAQCRCGWEDFVGKGIQEGFVGVLNKARYGFITKERPRERNPTGVYFRESHLRGYPFEQLQIGDRVHFKVGQNDKGCVAEQIDVQGKDPFPGPVSQGLVSQVLKFVICNLFIFHKKSVLQERC